MTNWIRLSFGFTVVATNAIFLKVWVEYEKKGNCCMR